MYLSMLEFGMWNMIIPNSVGIMVGSSFRNTKIVIMVLPMFFIPIILFAGIISNTGRRV
jgi:hypothetical protein